MGGIGLGSLTFKEKLEAAGFLYFVTRLLNVTFIITELRASLFIEQCLLGFSTTGKPTRSFATERVSLDSV